MAKISKNEESELNEAFVINDRDCDGKINFNELKIVVRSIGLSPTEAELIAIRDEYEKSGTRLWSLNETSAVAKKLNATRETAESLREAFRIFDKDGNGYVSIAELRLTLTLLGERLKDEEVDEMIREINILEGGQVCYDDFVHVLISGQ